MQPLPRPAAQLRQPLPHIHICLGALPLKHRNGGLQCSVQSSGGVFMASKTCAPSPSKVQSVHRPSAAAVQVPVLPVPPPLVLQRGTAGQPTWASARKSGILRTRSRILSTCSQHSQGRWRKRGGGRACRHSCCLDMLHVPVHAIRKQSSHASSWHCGNAHASSRTGCREPREQLLCRHPVQVAPGCLPLPPHLALRLQPVEGAAAAVKGHRPTGAILQQRSKRIGGDKVSVRVETLARCAAQYPHPDASRFTPGAATAASSPSMHLVGWAAGAGVLLAVPLDLADPPSLHKKEKKQYTLRHCGCLEKI